jgi:hypothetical protein
MYRFVINGLIIVCLLKNENLKIEELSKNVREIHFLLCRFLIFVEKKHLYSGIGKK